MRVFVLMKNLDYSDESVEKNDVDNLIDELDDYEESEENNNKDEKEIAPGLKLLKESRKAYRVADVDGNEYWICKACLDLNGKIVRLNTPAEIRIHYSEEHADLAGTRKVNTSPYGGDKIEKELTVNETEDYVPTIEEELTSKRAKKLYYLLKEAPGVNRKIVPWICKVFQSTKRLHNPEALHIYLKKNTKLDDDDIRFIVYSVFEIPEEDNSVPFYDDMYKEEKPSYEEEKVSPSTSEMNNSLISSINPLSFSGGLSIRTIDDLIKLIDFFERRLKNNSNNVDIKEIEQRAYMKAKLEMMEKELKDWQEEKKMLYKMIKEGKIGRGEVNEWSFMEDLVDKVYKGTSGVAKEISKLSRLVLLLSLGKRKGYTDDDIMKMIENEVGEDYIE